MSARLRERILWRTASALGDGKPDPAVMARAGAYMFFAVGFFALASLLLSPFPQANVPALAGLVGCAWAMAASLLLAFDRMPTWGFQVLLAGGTVLASGAVYFSGEGSSTYAFFYLLMVLYAFYFFPRAEALCHLVFVGTAFAWALVALAPPDPVGRWVIAIGTLAMAAHMVSVLRGRVEALIGRLSEAARSDPLTGVLNRRGFEELLDRELERARRTDQALSVIMVDLDHFKRLNDRLGHGMGDIALRRVAEVLDQGRRHIDTIARLGGEEFAVILPDTDGNGAYVLAERLRSNVSSAFLGTRCPLTASFGVASFPEHGRARSALMESCDQALYAAKELGRDRCVSFGADVSVISNGGSFLNHGESEARLATLLALAEALDLRDHGTAEHCRAVGRYAAMAARELGFDDGRVERVRIAGTLHDVGKVGLSESVLRKPGPLSDAERSDVQRHPELGAQILSGSSFDDVRQWIMAHHERPDGRGYPSGLREDEIPLEASILAVADSYEAMTADRSYRPAMGDEAARRELRVCSAEQFSPVVVEAFLRALERQPEHALA